MRTAGASILSVAPGCVEIAAPVGDAFAQQQGFVHAGLTFALGDSAAGYAALSLLAEHEEVVTSEMKIHLLSPARGERLIARGQVVKPGKRLLVVRADVEIETPAGRRQIATLLGTMVPVPSQHPPG